jgi:single-strand DNA-binding protein
MLNTAILMGRLVKDPEMRSTQSGTPVCSFTLAVNRRGKDDGTDFLDIVAWSKTAEFVSKYFQKGQLVAVKGRIQTRTWEDQNNNKRKSTEIVAEEVHFAESKRSGGNEQVVDPMAALGGFGMLPGDDGDLPF